MSSSTDALIAADEWFAEGKRVHFDHRRKEIAPEKRKDTVPVFQRVVMPRYSNADAQWLTMLPGLPLGSFGYAKVEEALQANKNLNADIPRLYVDYVGQGNSDKPKEGYNYGTIERANLVEAHWKAQGVKSTVLISQDFSSLVMMELLLRQKDREAKGIRYPRIEHVLSINGAYHADGHSHGPMNTPAIRGAFGPVSSSAAQRSTYVFNKMLTPLYSKEYRKAHTKLWKKEVKEAQKAIRLHQGTRNMSQMTDFVDEHKKRADRWDLLKIFKSYCKEQDITFLIVGSDQDPFHKDQIDLVRYRFQSHPSKLKVATITGGYFCATEQPSAIADHIVKLVQTGKSSHEKPQRSWAQVEAPTYKAMSWTATPRTANVDYGF